MFRVGARKDLVDYDSFVNALIVPAETFYRGICGIMHQILLAVCLRTGKVCVNCGYRKFAVENVDRIILNVLTGLNGLTEFPVAFGIWVIAGMFK